MKLLMIIGLTSITIGFGGGYQLRDLQFDADRTKAVEMALAKQAQIDRVSREQEIALVRSQQKTQTVYKTIIKEVPKYVTPIQQRDSECNLSLGAVRLFNSAASGRLPSSTGIDDGTSTGSSTVKESDLINYGLNVIEQYNTVKNQCNALIDWHKRVNKNDLERK